VGDGSYRPRRILLTLIAAAAVTLASMPAVHADPRPTIEQVQRRVGDLYHTAEQATERYNDARIALADAERKFAQAQSRVAAQQAELAKKQEVIGALAVEAYRSGGVDPKLRLLLAEDPKQVLERASALDLLSERQAASIRAVADAQRVMQADRLVAAQQLAAVERWRQTLAKEKSTVEGNLRAAQEQLNSLRAEERRRLAAAEARRRAAEAAEARRQAAALAQRASRSRTSAPTPSAPTPSTASAPPVSGRAAEAVKYAYAQLGDRYVWGAAGPDAFDCSGLTMMAWRAAGVSLPHSSRMQYDVGTKVSRSQLQPGDLVFFYSPISHVGIYIGGGKMIHAPNPSQRVKIDPISYMPYTGASRP
jgi:cell wall-associated NlpC family hydrolase